MSEQNIQVIVDGAVVEGATLAQVKPRIAQLFKTTVDKVEPMFSGRPFAIKKGLDLETARKYQAALLQAGLLSTLAAAPQPAATPPQEISIAATGSDIDTTPAPAPVNIDTSAISIAEAGITIMEHPPIAAAQIDTSRYQVEAVGQTLDERPPVAAPAIDISRISLANAGEDVMEYLPIPEVDLETTFTMADAGTTIMEHKPVPPAQIDTSKIKLADE